MVYNIGMVIDRLFSVGLVSVGRVGSRAWWRARPSPAWWCRRGMGPIRPLAVSIPCARERFGAAARREVCEMRETKLAGVGFPGRAAGECIDTCS